MLDNFRGLATIDIATPTSSKPVIMSSDVIWAKETKMRLDWTKNVKIAMKRHARYKMNMYDPNNIISASTHRLFNFVRSLP